MGDEAISRPTSRHRRLFAVFSERSEGAARAALTFMAESPPLRVMSKDT